MRILGITCIAFCLLSGFARPFTFAQTSAIFRISFPASRTRVPVGDTRMIAFNVDPPAPKDLLLPASGDRTGVLEILQPPEVLAGHSLGFMRVRGLKAGSTTIRAGDAHLDLIVYRLRRIDPPASEFPTFLSPPNGAFLWGDVTAAVEIFRDPLSPPDSYSPVVLDALGIRRFEADRESLPEEGPFVLTTFLLKQSLLPPGPATFIATGSTSQGVTIDSHPLVVEVGQVRNPEVDLEAEAYATEPRPESLRYRSDSSVQTHPDASQNKCVVIRGESQALTVDCKLKLKGKYQVMARVRGDAGGAAYPTIGLLINDETDPSAVARVFSSAWHRIPIGRPIDLPAGRNRLTFVFLNEFQVPEMSDRNLYIDTIELAHVRALVPLRGVPEASSAMEMGMGTMMSGESADPMPGYGPGPLRIAQRNVIHGRKVAGTFRVEARTWWDRAAEPRPPRTYLLLNGDSVTHVRAVDPLFNIRKDQLTPGANNVQLQAIADNGDSAFTPVQTVWLEGDAPPPGRSDADHLLKERDTTPPEILVLYPPADHRVSGADAVVAWVQDNVNLQSADLIIDDEPQFLDLVPDNQLGELVLPVLARSLKPGRHEFQVRAWDDAGNQQISAPRSFLVEPIDPIHPGKYHRAIRLLNRFGYGRAPRELAAILIQGEKSWLTSRLRKSFRSPDERALQAYLLAAYPDDDSRTHVERRVSEQLMRTDNPARIRFVMWLENHFSTWIQKTGPASKWDEHIRFCMRGAAPFSELLYASATSPAMLYYLDQNRSFRGQINENYAREIMELHTLGVDGGYSQADVTELAKLLTGWTVDDEADLMRPGHNLVRTFRFAPSLNHGEERIVVGKRFRQASREHRFDRIRQALEVLSAHPNTASFVCGKLIEHYVQVPAPEAMKQDLAKAFMESGGDMVAVMVAMAARDEFWDNALPAKFTTPLDFGIHLARISPTSDPAALNRFLGNSGMLLFGRPTPDGYPEEPGEYADTNAFLQRWNHSQAAQKGLASVIPDSWRDERRFRSGLEQQRLIDLAAIRLTGTLLSKRSNEAALQAVSAATGSPNERAEQLAAFIGYLPEMHLR
jgi:uncharacterized protein (DUF1800 family)